jgi:hypothetical protein
MKNFIYITIFAIFLLFTGCKEDNFVVYNENPTITYGSPGTIYVLFNTGYSTQFPFTRLVYSSERVPILSIENGTEIQSYTIGYEYDIRTFNTSESSGDVTINCYAPAGDTVIPSTQISLSDRGVFVVFKNGEACYSKWIGDIKNFTR